MRRGDGRRVGKMLRGNQDFTTQHWSTATAKFVDAEKKFTQASTIQPPQFDASKQLANFISFVLRTVAVRLHT